MSRLNLNGLVGGAIATGFELFADLVFPFTYRATRNASYTPTTGAVSVPTGIASTGLWLDFTAKEMENAQVQTGDKQVLVRVTNLPGIAPRMDDYIEQGGHRWQIVRVYQDPTGQIWIFHLRRVQG